MYTVLLYVSMYELYEPSLAITMLEVNNVLSLQVCIWTNGNVLLAYEWPEGEGVASAHVETYASGYAESHARIWHAARGRVQHPQGHPAESLSGNIHAAHVLEFCAFTHTHTFCNIIRLSARSLPSLGRRMTTEITWWEFPTCRCLPWRRLLHR